MKEIANKTKLNKIISKPWIEDPANMYSKLQKMNRYQIRTEGG